MWNAARATISPQINNVSLKFESLHVLVTLYKYLGNLEDPSQINKNFSNVRKTNKTYNYCEFDFLG